MTNKTLHSKPMAIPVQKPKERLRSILAAGAVGLSVLSCGARSTEPVHDPVSAKPPESAEAHVNKGIEYFRNNRPLYAIREFTTALKINTADREAYCWLGAVYFWSPESSYLGLEAGRESYEKMIELNPKDGIAYYGLGVIYAEQRKFDKAIEAYTRAIELNPNIAYFYQARAAAYDSIGKPDLAEKDRAGRMPPEDSLEARMHNFMSQIGDNGVRPPACR